MKLTIHGKAAVVTTHILRIDEVKSLSVVISFQSLVETLFIFLVMYDCSLLDVVTPLTEE